MAFITALWLPILVCAVGVFVASSVIHMVFKWHSSDYLKLGNEDEVRAAIRASSPGPGQYAVPYCGDMKLMGSPEMQKKFTEGPIAWVTLRAPGMPAMGPMLGQWFVLNLVVAALAGYIASKTLLPVPVTFLGICREVGVITFLAYAGGSVSNGIWMGKPWSSVAKEVLDAIIYGAVSALVFAWLWPH
ncbi:MAG TPA: hypothetical protein VH040_11580 [Usitatibacter sp.]|jgi:hypothetical protein|nr:hypothetical protein [Usitatibacter sp.]